MPITLRRTTPDERAAEGRRRAELAATVTLAVIEIPTGGEVIVEDTPGGYQLNGDLRLFGVDLFGTIPLTAVSDADAVAQADAMVRARWVRECGG